MGSLGEGSVSQLSPSRPPSMGSGSDEQSDEGQEDSVLLNQHASERSSSPFVSTKDLTPNSNWSVSLCAPSTSANVRDSQYSNTPSPILRAPQCTPNSSTRAAEQPPSSPFGAIEWPLNASMRVERQKNINLNASTNSCRTVAVADQEDREKPLNTSRVKTHFHRKQYSRSSYVRMDDQEQDYDMDNAAEEDYPAEAGSYLASSDARLHIEPTTDLSSKVRPPLNSLNALNSSESQPRVQPTPTGMSQRSRKEAPFSDKISPSPHESFNFNTIKDLHANPNPNPNPTHPDIIDILPVLPGSKPDPNHLSCTSSSTPSSASSTLSDGTDVTKALTGSKDKDKGMGRGRGTGAGQRKRCCCRRCCFSPYFQPFHVILMLIFSFSLGAMIPTAIFYPMTTQLADQVEEEVQHALNIRLEIDELDAQLQLAILLSKNGGKIEPLNYTAIDILGDTPVEPAAAELYSRLLPYKDLPGYANDSRFVARFGLAQYMHAFLGSDGNEKVKLKYLYEANATLTRALELSEGKDWFIWKWLAINDGQISNLSKDMKKKYEGGKRVKANTDRALSMFPEDPICWVVSGRFTLEISQVQGLERTIAQAILGSMPELKLEDALHQLTLADRLFRTRLGRADKVGLHQLARAYIAKGDKQTAANLLVEADALPCQTIFDRIDQPKVSSLLAHYRQYATVTVTRQP